MGVLTLGVNKSAIGAARQLDIATRDRSDVFTRLSSGIRINSASDDAAGLAVASTLAMESRVYSQGIRNINDGISLLNIADGATQQLSEIVQRQQELAEQSANGTLSRTQRVALQKEATALVNEYNRIVGTTKFNGITVLDTSLSTFRVQAGYGTSGSIASAVAQEMDRATLGSGYDTANTKSATLSISSFEARDLNGDGRSDLVYTNGFSTGFFVELGNGDGSFLATVSYGGATGFDNGRISFGDFNRDGVADLLSGDWNSSGVYVALGNANGTFNQVISYAATGFTEIGRAIAVDANNDGYQDIVTTDSKSNGRLAVLLGTGTGTFGAATTYTTSYTDGNEMSAHDFNNDGNIDLLRWGVMGAPVVQIGNGNGSFRSPITIPTLTTLGSPSVTDFNGDGILDIGAGSEIVFGNGDGTFGAPRSFGFTTGYYFTSAPDANNDGAADLIGVDGSGTSATTNIKFGNGDGTFSSGITFSLGSSVNNTLKLADLNGDGVLDLVNLNGIAGTIEGTLAKTTQTATMKQFWITTAADARASITYLGGVANNLTMERGALGSALSRHESALNSTEGLRMGRQSAYGTIMDADISEDAAKLVSTSILQKTATAVLAQANQSNAAVMKLIL